MRLQGADTARGRIGGRFAVLGAGALGLTVALRLAERGEEVIVYERESRPGGLAAGFPLGRSHLEKFYHHLFQTDHDAIALIEHLGLGDRLAWRRPVTAVLKNGELWPMDSASDVLAFRPIPMPDRLRLGASLACLKARRGHSSFVRDSVESWCRRWMGSASYEALWRPLLESKFGERHADIVMPWFWARVHYRTARLGYLRGGFQQLYDTLSHRIAGLGGLVRLEAEVREVVPETVGFQVATDRETQRFDFVVSTLPARVTFALVPTLPPAFTKLYGQVEALGAMCLVLETKWPLTSVYWLNLNDPGFSFQPLVQHTNLVPPTDYRGWHIAYLGNYLPVTSDLFRMDAGDVLATFLPQIRRLQPDFEPSWVTESWLFRAPNAQPIVTRRFARTIPPHFTPIPGLFLATMFQIYPQDRGQNYSIRLAERLVRDVL